MMYCLESIIELLPELEQNLFYVFFNKELLVMALCHKSYNSLKNNKINFSNERLEFLGDRVLGLLTSEALYKNTNNFDESRLARSLSYINSGETLYKVALDINLKKFIYTVDIDYDSSAMNKICSDAVEAIFAAIYLDSGMGSAKKVYDKLLSPSIKTSFSLQNNKFFNPKSYIQEWSQKNNLSVPVYIDVKEEGSKHQPIFHVSLSVEGYDQILAIGPTKKEAQKVSARNFIKKYDIIL